MPPHRDLAAFEQRAPGYEEGWLGRRHHEIADRTARLVLSEAPLPESVLDVGCGTGYLLRVLATAYPETVELVGVDPSPAMVRVAEAAGAGAGGVAGAGAAAAGMAGVAGVAGKAGDRLSFAVGAAERLPFPDDSFGVVVSTTSFDHWSDQLAGLTECARVTRQGGRLALVDQFSVWLAPTLLFGRRGKAAGRSGEPAASSRRRASTLQRGGTSIPPSSKPRRRRCSAQHSILHMPAEALERGGSALSLGSGEVGLRAV